MSRSPSAVAQRRVQSELKDWLQNPPEGCRLLEFEPMTRWVVEIQGPELYSGATYRLLIVFTDRYPLSPPDVTFLAPSPVHPHVYTNGHICLDVLYDHCENGGWSPALTMNKIALSLRSMLASNTDLSRPAGDREYCARMVGRSPRETRWMFDDDRV